MSEFWTEKSLLQGPSKENGQLMLKKPKLSDGFQGRVFKGKFGGRAAGYMTFFWLVGGEIMWCSKSLNHQPSGSNWSGVHMLMLSLKLPSSTWVAMWLSFANATLTLNINLSSWNILHGFQIPYIWGMPNSHVEWSTWKKTVVPSWQSQLSTVWMKPFRPLILPRSLPDAHCKGGKILLYQISD